MMLIVSTRRKFISAAKISVTMNRERREATHYDYK